MTFLLKTIGEIMQPLFYLLAFMTKTCILQGKIIDIDKFEFTNFSFTGNAHNHFCN